MRSSGRDEGREGGLTVVCGFVQEGLGNKEEREIETNGGEKRVIF